MYTLTIQYNQLNNDKDIFYSNIDVEEWWTEYYIIDKFWNDNGRSQINKQSIKILKK